jgi:hypothetical protein
MLERSGSALLLLYILAGFIYSAVLAPIARFPDESEYLKLSYNLIHGPGFSMDGVHLTACRPPGYAFFLSAIRAFGGHYFCFRIAQFLLLGGTVFLAYQLSSEKKEAAGLLIVTGLAICYPILFYASGTLYPQTLSAFLFILALLLLLKAKGKSSISFGSGLVFGLLILVVPTFLLTLGVVVLVARYLQIVRSRDVVLVLLAAGLMAGTWTLRNAVIFHRFVPVASNSGVNLLMGNNEQATPFAAAANTGMEPYYQQEKDLGMDEFQADQFYKQAALDWIKANPGRALLLYFEKVLNFFNVFNVYVPGNHEEISFWKQIVMAGSYLLLIGLLCWRLSDLRQFPLVPREKLFLAIYVLSAFTSAIFFTRIRHRIPYDYLLIAIVAHYLSYRLELWLMSGRKLDLPASDNELLRMML